MNKAFDKLNIYHHVVVLSGLFLLLVTIGLSPLFFVNIIDIPLGIILGVGYGMASNFLIGLLENKRSDTYKWAVVVTILRTFFFAIILIVITLCYYKWDVRIFNVFSYVGGYLFTTILLVLVYLTHHRKES